MFADDLALILDIVIGLQRLLNLLLSFCKVKDWIVNTIKQRSWCINTVGCEPKLRNGHAVAKR